MQIDWMGWLLMNENTEEEKKREGERRREVRLNEGRAAQ